VFLSVCVLTIPTKMALSSYFGIEKSMWFEKLDEYNANI
jgi:hypothetical protein